MALTEAGFTQFLSGMAEVTDICLGCPHCILPCTAQAEKRSASSQELRRLILERVDSVVYVSRDYHKNCMLDCNRFLVENASVLLAYDLNSA